MSHIKSVFLASTLLAASTIVANAEVKVVASIKPIHSLVASVMEGVGEPGLIVEGAGSPHTYALKPSQAQMLEDADLVFWIGHELEAFLEKPLEAIATNARSVELMDAHDLVKLEFREGGAFDSHEHDDEEEHADHEDHDDHDHEKHADHDDHDDHAHGSYNPHIWLDPINAKALVHEIEEALAKADPDNAETYETNAAALADRLDQLNAEVSAELQPVREYGYVVFHDAYQNFEMRFGLSAAGSITVSPEVIPGAERIRELRAKVQELGATCVFSEPQFEPKIVGTVAEGTSAKTGVLDPLGAAIDVGPELYFALIRNMSTSFKTCLSEPS